METIKDLRDLLAKNEGKVMIGSLSIETVSTNDERADIDIKLCSDLLLWITSSVKDEILLKDVMDTVSSDFVGIRGKIQEKNKILKEQEEKITSLESQNKLEGHNLGKIEAYEKILFDRNITITK